MCKCTQHLCLFVSVHLLISRRSQYIITRQWTQKWVPSRHSEINLTRLRLWCRRVGASMIDWVYSLSDDLNCTFVEMLQFCFEKLEWISTYEIARIGANKMKLFQLMLYEYASRWNACIRLKRSRTLACTINKWIINKPRTPGLIAHTCLAISRDMSFRCEAGFIFKQTGGPLFLRHPFPRDIQLSQDDRV